MTGGICEILSLGTTPYEQALDLQLRLVDEVRRGERSPTLLLLEHPHVYTFGKRGQIKNLLWDDAELAHRGITTHWVDRGGDVTYHGPGQLVGYPILPLLEGGWPGQTADQGIVQVDYVGYVRKLEKSLIKMIAGFGLVSGQISGLTGVWVQPDVASRCRHCPPEARKKPSKIASIGVRVDVHGITRHGFALNVHTNRDYWDGIISCGMDYPVVNLADLLWKPPEMEDVIQQYSAAFCEVFNYRQVIRSKI